MAALARDAGSRARKKTAHATKQDRPDILKRREEWFDGQLDRSSSSIFIDETRALTNRARRYGRAPRGDRMRAACRAGTEKPPPSWESEPHRYYRTLSA